MFCYRELEKGEYKAALQLSLKVFMEYEVPDYTQEGIETFRNLMNDENYIAEIRCYGAFDQEKGCLVGVIATRNKGNHITLFFGDGQYHRRGIGKELMKFVVADNKSGKLTVNSSPYAVEIYKKLGFVPTNPEEISEGIRFTHMEMMV